MKLKKIYKNMSALLKRTMWAKILGFIVSLLAFIWFIMNGYYTDNSMMAWGILFWYPLVGVMVGLSGTMDKHPLLGKMTIWRGIILGASMNFVLVLFAMEPFSLLAMQVGFDVTHTFMILGSIIEGAIIGGAIDWIVTAKFGEGKKLMKK